MLFDAVGGEHGKHIAAERPTRAGEALEDLVVVADFLGEFVAVVACLQKRPIRFPHMGGPAIVEGFHVHADQAVEQLVGVVLAVPETQDTADLFGAVIVCDIFHQRVALLVAEEDIALAPSRVHGFKGDEPVGEYRVAQDHFIDGISAWGGVLGHALHDPGRRLRDRARDAFDGAFVHDIVLEDVGQLVHQHVAELVEVAVKGDDHAKAQWLGETCYARWQEIGEDIGLLELVVGLVDDDRRPVRQLVVQNSTDMAVGLFEIFDGLHSKVLELRLEVQL